ncbi:hypothetical protein GXW82_44560 [Streptacidiphilus sp. 4-A2]|nr:hypothetical protein [Streptacidiphilus sp. 4-A2]
MSNRTVGHPGLDRAAASAARAAGSAARERQLWWVAGELARALQHPDYPLGPEAAVEDLLEDLQATTAYLALGAAGELRVRATARKADKENADTTRMRRAVLGLLADAVGTEAHLPSKAPRQPSKVPVPPRPREMLRETLADLQQRTGAAAPPPGCGCWPSAAWSPTPAPAPASWSTRSSTTSTRACAPPGCAAAPGHHRRRAHPRRRRRAAAAVHRGGRRLARRARPHHQPRPRGRPPPGPVRAAPGIGHRAVGLRPRQPRRHPRR